MVDVACRFHEISHDTYRNVLAYLEAQRDRMYSGEVIDALLSVMPETRYMSLRDRNIDDILNEELPHRMGEYPFEQVKSMMDVFGKIVDYKSPFTRNHSEGVADRVYRMALNCGYGEQTAERLYIAGALHDIGKMAIGNDILEKPARLTSEEFVAMKNHAFYTYLILGKINGFGDITRWASCHHEKLDGEGYPFGKTAEQLDEKDRMMACADIYEALREDRPYKPGMTHEEAVSVMRDMAAKGFIDAEMTEITDRLFGGGNVG